MFRQYHGNDMELLRALAARALARDPPPPLAAEWIVVPNVGMAKWLRHGIAEECGIAAQLDCLSPGRFLDALAGVLFGPETGRAARAWSKEQLEIRLMAVLPSLLEQPEFAPVAGYLEDTRDPRRLLALARALASVFDQYLLYRPDWLLAWEHGRAARDEPERAAPWQPLLWRALCAAIAHENPHAVHGAARAERMLELLRATDAPPGLPSRVTGFGLGALSPLLLEILATLARHCEVGLYHFNPCREFWGEIRSERVRARLRLTGRDEHVECGNRLLASWGGQGREQLQLLLEQTEGDIEDCFLPIEGDSVLACVQRDIAELSDGESGRELARGDDSIRFAHAHSRLREIEALHDELLDRFQRCPGLAPREIVVMAPEIEQYAAHIEAVFGETRGGARHIPFTIADRAEAAQGAIAHSFLHLLALPESRFRASDVFALLAVPALAARAGLAAADVEELREITARAGIRWGLDQEASAGTGPGLARNTWSFGLRRLLLGLALEEGELLEGIAALEAGGASGSERVGLLAEFVDRLAWWARELRSAREPREWQALLASLLEAFYEPGIAQRAELGALGAVLDAQFAALAEGGYDAPLARGALLDLLAHRLEQPDGAHAFLRGAVNFCRLTPLRSIPFRIVCLLGMNADAFPRNRERAGFDLMGGAGRRLADPSRRDDDRYLFLESLLAARDALYISHVARDERTDAEREPAVPLSELRDYIDQRWGERSAERLTRVHRLKPFHADYFHAGSELFSYRAEWLPAAHASDTAAPRFCTVPLPARNAAEPVTTGALGSFFRNPCAGFLQGRFAVSFEDVESAIEDLEPFELDNLQHYDIKRALVVAVLDGHDARARLLAEGVLPHGATGEALLDGTRARLEDLIARVREWWPHEPRSHAIELTLGAHTLRGTLGGMRAQVLRDFTLSSKASARTQTRFWISHLLACAGVRPIAPSELDDANRTHRFALLSAQQASAHLGDLLAVRAEGICRPLALFPAASLAYAQAIGAAKGAGEALDAARAAFLGGYMLRGECEDEHVARLFPDARSALDEDFAMLALRVYAPMLATRAEAEQ